MRYPVINLEKTGKNIYKFSRKKGITANDIKNFMNFSSSQAIYRWFHGKSLPAMDNFYALSFLLGTSLDVLLANDSGVRFIPGKEEHVFLYIERLGLYRECMITV